MGFIPNTKSDKKEMLDSIGVDSFSELIDNIPQALQFKGELKLPEALSEFQIMKHMSELSAKNSNCLENVCFLGGGAYDHYVPSVVKHLLSRSEFYTAYTPYQPEVSQGTLQTIYEFQTMICELTGMDVANASVYDGGSALAEAMLLSTGYTKRNTVLLSGALNPNYVDIIKTYAHGREINVILVPVENGITDISALKNQINDQVAAVIVQHPNFFGSLEEMQELSDITHQAGALFVTSNDPISLAILEPPASYGADIATGEGQALGNALNFGGPYLGLFAAKQNLVRLMPGRIVGKTVDKNNKSGFVLTLQTREQHIRREKATSNICTNQGLVALAATIYMALMGKNGLPKIADLCLQKSHYLFDKLCAIPGIEPVFDRPFFKEFVIRINSNKPVSEYIELLSNKGFLAGIELKPYFDNMDNTLLIAVTEKRTKQEMDEFCSAIEELFQ